MNIEKLRLTMHYLLEDAELLEQYVKDKQFAQAELIYQQIKERLNVHQLDIASIMEILRKYNLTVDLVSAYERSDQFVQD